LGPKLGFPCSFHVATDNIVAFELTRLQDFHVIIVAQNKIRHDYFDTSNLIAILKALDGCCPPIIFLTDDENQLAGQRSNCSEIFYVRCCAGNEFVLDELCAAIYSAVQKTNTNTAPSQVSTPPSAMTTLQKDFVVAAPVNLQSLFAMELEATHFQSAHQLSPNPMSVPVVEDDGVSFSFEIDDFDSFLADLCDDSDDANLNYNNSSFLTQDHLGKRRFSFDSDGTVEDSTLLTPKRTKSESKHMGQYHRSQCTTILDPEDFEQLLQMFPDCN
jgi:hypothetical protein